MNGVICYTNIFCRVVPQLLKQRGKLVAQCVVDNINLNNTSMVGLIGETIQRSVAQLVERLIWDQDVGSSNLPTPIYNTAGGR